jgi:hypothetical protein
VINLHHDKYPYASMITLGYAGEFIREGNAKAEYFG